MSKRRNLLDSAEKRRSLQNVAVARGRLKGALADIVTHSDEDSDSDDSLATRQSKRSKTATTDSIPIPHQSYIMKLFDRSVDLARFDESTPLYPICRAWMQNQPRMNHKPIRTPSPVKREYNPQMAVQYRNGELKDIRAMPRPEANFTHQYPSTVENQQRASKDIFDPALETIPKAVLLKEHKKHWTQVRRNWEQYNRVKAERYETSFELLDALLKTQA